ncbi:MAG: hypothetical protein KAH22_00760 [Thiotrichaceae bacterium]|nr:hypothetical protein [Thiotrichaceae bacterium]
MSDTDLTLNDLFDINFTHLPEATLYSLDMTAEMHRLHYAVKAALPHDRWHNIRKNFLQELAPLLDISLKRILLETWQSLESVKAIFEEQNKGDQGSTVIKLMKHNLRSSHCPRLAIQFNQQDFELQLFIAIDLDIEDLSLKIDRGEIIEILTGCAKGKGIIQYQNITLNETDVLPLSLVGDMPKRLVIPPNIPNIQSQKSTHQRARKGLSNVVQFIIGITIALVAVYLFWVY